jgi:hypothetical protein
MVAEPASASAARQRLLAIIEEDEQDLVDLCLYLASPSAIRRL